MLVVKKVLVSDEIRDNFFVCDLIQCKGACCVEGDLGAPLEQNELEEMHQIQEAVADYLTDEGRQAIAEQGAYILDEDGDYSTPTIGGKECAYAYYDQQSVLKCGIEKAWLDGKTKFRKPVSCHLYPIRISRYAHYEAVNYNRWEICNPACDHGEALKVPLYVFLKESLIRKYGYDWYNELLEVIDASQTSV
jgi:hypothetical protein